MEVEHKESQKRVIWVPIVIGVAGVGYTLIGLALILAPLWFFDNIGPFAPYNRHYEGDLGMFLLPLGLGLLVAAREPHRHRLLLAVAAAGSLLHAGNHLYDAMIGATPATRFIQDVGPLIALGLLVLVAWWGTRGRSPI
jgi:ABC-type transport system involved in cytochrome c biogenesis permease subunit